MSKIVCFGEVLWDVFPTHKKIGGAPLNVALRLGSFDNDVTVISSVGNDLDGKKLIDFIKEHKISTKEIQTNNEHQTGCVKVTIDSTGNATYDIEFPCAWDFIELKQSALATVKDSDAFIYGSLVSRNEVAKNTLQQLIKQAKFKIFDVNLRAPHYTMTLLEELMDAANFIKFNDDELLEICRYFNFESDDIEENIRFISEKTATKNICVTLGGEGAILFKDNNFYRSFGYKVNVKDTVGAGDSFLATLINQLLNENAPKDALDYACAIGALVASKNGANPIITTAEINTLMH